MTQSHHTPGPWYATNSGPHFWEITTQPVEFSPGIANTCASKHNFGSDVEEANAHLIAAAPELLAALEKITTLFGWMDGPEGWSEARKQAHAAIRKAKGASL